MSEMIQYIALFYSSVIANQLWSLVNQIDVHYLKFESFLFKEMIIEPAIKFWQKTLTVKNPVHGPLLAQRYVSCGVFCLYKAIESMRYNNKFWYSCFSYRPFMHPFVGCSRFGQWFSANVTNIRKLSHYKGAELWYYDENVLRGINWSYVFWIQLLSLQRPKLS